jgi:uncharacterized protein
MAKERMRGSGGSEGGVGQFAIGFVLSIASLTFFFNSVQVTNGTSGWVSSLVTQGMGNGTLGTASMGLLFVPFFLGVLVLFYDSKKTWGWLLMWAGLGILVVEIMSRITFFFNFRASYLLLLIVLFAAGAGMMLRSYRAIDEVDDSSK